MRWYFVEADPSVAFHLLLGVNLQLFVRVHWHQHWSDVSLNQNIQENRQHTSNTSHPTNNKVLIQKRKLVIELLRRWGFPRSASVDSLWRLLHYWNFPARQSPALRPCPGLLRRSPSLGALFPPHPPPTRKRAKEEYEKIEQWQCSSTNSNIVCDLY